MSGRRNAIIPLLSNAESYFDFFDGLINETSEKLEKRQLPGGLLKSYLLETVGDSNSISSFIKIVERSELSCEPIGSDGRIFRVTDSSRQGIAVIERIGNRYLSFYTLLPSSESDRLVRKAVAANPMIDHLWLSSQSFHALWNHVRSTNSGKRYGKITFEHESIYDFPDDELEDGEPSHFEDEKRASRFTMVDRLDVIEAQMEPLRETYAPLASITHLRIPAAARGGHDLYYDGKVTNRSDSFLDHRATLLNVVDMYKRLTATVEEKLWTSSSTTGGGDFVLNNAVAELVFSQPLSEDTFRRWVISLFNNRRNRFRISGFHTWLSDRKVHANAIDQHLWQPIILEMTNERLIAVLPEGTCGNTINRLVSNIQRFVDPKVRAYIGDSEYSTLVPIGGQAKVG
ncbi:hypothetical protein GCM10010156_42450 [Planobispora rosea]|uniref:Uncharacterized protein n=1 Tax=Planobispora rosea TaxID=35762 RepID=A0A8J3S2V4_PLARO|nr:hypothetical protein [Planobispora rosea]GGS79178.1 hypothetical protein GCM10010156_42450 [Planobispora rosea]GIH85769.1 hypothetical protein Pro02_41770 [Planobispora rosea]